jgi:hypothetical protein
VFDGGAVTFAFGLLEVGGRIGPSGTCCCLTTGERGITSANTR